jgi:hypothetical protein
MADGGARLSASSTPPVPVLGFSYAEAAAVRDCPMGMVRSPVARAREDLVAADDHPRRAT